MANVDNGSPWVFELNLRFEESGAGLPFSRIVAFNATHHGAFDQAYNNRSALIFSAAKGAKRVHYEVLLSGHGDMEFVPSKHVFTVNGKANYTLAFMEPLDEYGCAKKVRQGVEPNGYGAYVSRIAYLCIYLISLSLHLLGRLRSLTGRFFSAGHLGGSMVATAGVMARM